MEKLNVAVIGCGRIAGHHCRNIVSNQDMKLVAVCDLEFLKAEAYGKEFNVVAYDNYRTMMENHPEINLVAVITPSGMHYEHTKEIIEKYKKHVVVEKPTFLKLLHLKEIYACAEKAGVQVFPVFQNRYNKAVQRVKHALANGELGDSRLFSVRVRWCRPQKYYDLSPWRGTFAMDGGAITNQGIHHIDLLRYLGGDIEEVSAKMNTFGAQIEVEDTCVATLKFKNGALGTLEITTAARPDDFEASISVVGSKGLMQIGGIAVNELQTFTLESRQNTDADKKENSEDFSTCVYGNGHNMLYLDIVKHFKGQAKFPVTMEEAFKSISLLHAFYVSNETEKAVSPSEGLESKKLGSTNEELANLYRTIGRN